MAIKLVAHVLASMMRSQELYLLVELIIYFILEILKFLKVSVLRFIKWTYTYLLKSLVKVMVYL
jgi:hypothetical protein